MSTNEKIKVQRKNAKKDWKSEEYYSTEELIYHEYLGWKFLN
jgi:hypothetical protein